MGNLSLKLSKENIDKIKNTFKNDIKPNKNEYIDTFIQKEGLTISIYKTNKVVFQGEDAIFYGSAFIENKFIRHGGSDEVGTGDYFGPVVVCACIVEENDQGFINNNHITDSKQMTDEKILSIGDELLKRFKYSLLILDNEKYNSVHETNNLNMIKAKMHNKAYLNLKSKGYKMPNGSYVDQFCEENLYYEYLSNEKEIYRNIIFETKAESKYAAVAVASCIARYAFLKKMEDLSKKYDFVFHKGASNEVDNDIKLFVNKFGKERLKEVAKLHFKNTNILD